MAAGTALIAASISMGTAPAASADVIDADPVSDLIGALDPNAFNALGLPDNVLGDLASGLDTYVTASTGLADALDPVIDGLLGSGLSLFWSRRCSALIEVFAEALGNTLGRWGDYLVGEADRSRQPDGG
jgi:hypothetical protein